MKTPSLIVHLSAGPDTEIANGLVCEFEVRLESGQVRAFANGLDFASLEAILQTYLSTPQLVRLKKEGA
jgi:hypothetical protein